VPPRKSRAMWQKLDQYFQVLENSTLADKSVEDYYYFAECFVRWADGDFVPGRGAKPNSRQGLPQVWAVGQ